jgi:sulfate transport system ATP-binding protein
MGFIGPVNRLGEAYVRPHDLEIRVSPFERASEAMVERIVYLGFEVRVELVRSDGQRAWSQLTRDEAERLEIADGQVVWVRSGREQVFTAA